MKIRSKFLGDAAIYTFSNIAAAGVPFILMPILTRVLDPAAYGTVAMFTVVVAFLTVGVGLNVHGAVMIRYFDKDTFNIPKYISTALLILAVTTVTVCVTIVIFEKYIVEITALTMGWMLIAAIVASLQFLVQLLLTLWQASKKPLQYGVFRLSQAVFDGLISIALVVLLALSWQGRISGVVITSGIAASVALYILIREGWISRSIDIDYAKDALRFGVPLVPHAIGGLLLGMADRFMITNLLDVSNTGIYVVAVQVSMILGIFVDSFNKAFAPWLMETLVDIDNQKKRRIVVLTYLYFVAVVLLALIGGSSAPYLLDVFIGPKYQSASNIIIYILLGNAFMGMYYMVANYIFFSRKTELLSALTITVGLITLSLTWHLIKVNGIAGAAQGFMVGQALLFVGAWVLSNYCVPMPWLNALRNDSAPS